MRACRLTRSSGSSRRLQWRNYPGLLPLSESALGPQMKSRALPSGEEVQENLVKAGGLLDIVTCTGKNLPFGGKSFCEEVADLLEDGTPPSRDDQLGV